MYEADLGTIALWPAGRIPKGWLPCDGRVLQITQFNALFSLIGTRYGGDQAHGTFALPDLRGRAALCAHMGPGDAPLGAFGGEETIALVPNQMPVHNHALKAFAGTGTAVSITNAVLASAGTSAHVPTPPQIYASNVPATTTLDFASVTNTGSGQPHNNMQPYLALNFVIATTGGYPAKS